MSMKMVCDRCGRVKDSTDIFSGIAFAKVTHGQPGEQSVQRITRDYDICESCAVEFEKFIDGGTVEEDHYKDSKPYAVVIHKLASGNYAIENAANDDESIDKEDPDLCVKSHKVTCPTTGETITVPDGKPWSSSGETRLCSNCVHELRPGYLEPCKSCEKHSDWEPKK